MSGAGNIGEKEGLCALYKERKREANNSSGCRTLIFNSTSLYSTLNYLIFLFFSFISTHKSFKMAGNFHETCELESIRIEDGRFLRCLVRREDGEFSEGEMDLNCCIGNENGEPTQ